MCVSLCARVCVGVLAAGVVNKECIVGWSVGETRFKKPLAPNSCKDKTESVLTPEPQTPLQILRSQLKQGVLTTPLDKRIHHALGFRVLG